MDCLCGKPTEIGRYCKQCLDDELRDTSIEDIEAAADFYDRTFSQKKMEVHDESNQKTSR